MRDRKRDCSQIRTRTCRSRDVSLAGPAVAAPGIGPNAPNEIMRPAGGDVFDDAPSKRRPPGGSALGHGRYLRHFRDWSDSVSIANRAGRMSRVYDVWRGGGEASWYLCALTRSIPATFLRLVRTGRSCYFRQGSVRQTRSWLTNNRKLLRGEVLCREREQARSEPLLRLRRQGSELSRSRAESCTRQDRGAKLEGLKWRGVKESRARSERELPERRECARGASAVRSDVR